MFGNGKRLDFDLDERLPFVDARASRRRIWRAATPPLSTSIRNRQDPIDEVNVIGFRVASIPEPSTLLLAVSSFAALLTIRRKSVTQNRA